MSFPMVEFGALISTEAFFDSRVDDEWGVAVATEADDRCDSHTHLIDGNRRSLFSRDAMGCFDHADQLPQWRVGGRIAQIVIAIHDPPVAI